MWGWSGINAFEWSVLLEIVAGLSNLAVGSLHFSTTSFHLYEQHWDKAQRISASGLASESRFTKGSPRFDPDEGDCWSLSRFDALAQEWFQVEGMIRHGNPAAVGAVNDFPEPMLRSWLRVLQWFWSGDEGFLFPIQGTRLHAACLVSVKPVGETQPEQLSIPEPQPSPRPALLPYLNKLHAEKHAAYGDSWKKRGEHGILGNIARKVDRIGSGKDTSDETQADTAIDLVVYLAKYRLWLRGFDATPEQVGDLLDRCGIVEFLDPPSFGDQLEQLFNLPSGGDGRKVAIVDAMLQQAYGLARSLWT
jgi:hypothetical protein